MFLQVDNIELFVRRIFMSELPRVGGQAVIEGVMMRGPKKYAVAIKKYNGNILLDKGEVKSIKDDIKILNLFILRGIVAFFESIMLGMKTLIFSADYFDIEEKSVEDKFVVSKEEEIAVENREKIDKQQDWAVFIAVILAIVFCIGIFFILPTFVASRFFNNVDPADRIWFNVVEGSIRIVLFFVYLFFVSLLKDVRRVFEFEGAEHKTINCNEDRKELTVENVKKYSKLHPRCGTSFLFIVMIISIIVFSFVSSENLIITILARILLLPIVAGISYEIITFFGKLKGTLGKILTMPGMWFQCFTTREPDDLQIFIAITALKAALYE